MQLNLRKECMDTHCGLGAGLDPGNSRYWRRTDIVPVFMDLSKERRRMIIMRKFEKYR